MTRRRGGGASGVELRDVAIALEADSRLEEQLADLPAVGWSEDVRSLEITLNLPPGYSLWTVRGADRVDRSWLGDWDLLGFFFVLVVAFGSAGLAGRLAGVVALVALGLAYHESDAPQAVWLLLLAAAALLRVLPAGRFWQLARALWFAGAIVFLIQGIPFAVRSVREALYPQLAERSGYSPSSVRQESPTTMPAPEGRAVEEVKQDRDGEFVGGAVADLAEGAAVQESPRRSAEDLYAAAQRKAAPARRDPEAVVQTGPGVPDWQFQSWQLSWSGPVARDHRIELVIVPPALQRVLALLRVVLCGLLAWLIARATPLSPPPSAASDDPASPSPPSAAATPALALALALAAALLPPARAAAQFPDQALLKELRERVTQPAECRPACVSVAELRVAAGDAGLELRAEVHAQDRTSVRVPGPLALWAPERVRLDGRDARMIAGADGFLQVRVEVGVHTLEVSGAIPPSDTLTLRLGELPARVVVESDGYEVSGVRADGTSEDAIELRRILQVGSQPAAVSLPPWFSVTRSFELGVEFRVQTVIERETPPGSPALVHLPLLAAESVHDARIEIKNGSAIVALGPDDVRFEFESTLAPSPALTLVAGQRPGYSERWQLACGTMWQCTTRGLPPVRHEADGRWQPLYRPWPGEKLTLALDKPAPARGQSTTLDAVKLIVRPGVRATEAQLRLSLRSSRGGVHKLSLPEAAALRSFTINRERRPVQRDGAAHSFSSLPGHAEVVAEFELRTGMASAFRAPRVELDQPVKNARVVIEVPPDRWLLWVDGPAWGPAILFWGYLVLVVLVALALGRLRRSPLPAAHWLLLGLGLTQVDALTALCVAGWFFAFGWRSRATELGRWAHNATQLALVFWTLAFAACLFEAVQHGLLVQPDMQVMGAGSHRNHLQWYVDSAGRALPAPLVLAAPLWVYRVLMLLWSLWLARRLVAWAPWAFGAFSAGGLWKRKPPQPPRAPLAVPVPPAAAPPTSPAP